MYEEKGFYYLKSHCYCFQLDPHVNRAHITRITNTTGEALRSHDGSVWPTSVCVWWSYRSDTTKWSV